MFALALVLAGWVVLSVCSGVALGTSIRRLEGPRWVGPSGWTVARSGLFVLTVPVAASPPRRR